MATDTSASHLSKSRKETPGQAATAAGHAIQHAQRLELIEQSHQRCAALGLSRIERPDYEPLMRGDLAVARERNQRLSSRAAPVMEMLLEQIINTNSMIVLTDAQGTVLHSVGDDDFLERAGKVALAPGANWAEHSKGTNAIGTALFAETPTLVHAAEHFMHANSFLTCSAAPIFDPRGNMLGVLDVTGDHRSYHRRAPMSAPRRRRGRRQVRRGDRPRSACQSRQSADLAHRDRSVLRHGQCRGPHGGRGHLCGRAIKPGDTRSAELAGARDT